MIRSHGNGSRHGAILVGVLVCLGIATTIVMLTVRSSLQVRRQMRHEMQMEQTRWLLDAAVHRAATQLGGQADYRSETWRVSPAFEAYPDATVDITVTTADQPKGKAKISVTAQLRRPGSNSQATRRSQTFVVDIPKPTDSGNP